MKLIFTNSELNEAKKVYLALGWDVKKIEDIAKAKAIVVKTDAELKLEIDTEIKTVKEVKP